MMRDRWPNLPTPYALTAFVMASTLVVLAGCADAESPESASEPVPEVAGTAPPAALGPPLDADIFLADLTTGPEEASAEVTRNVTSRWGYDNQPHWLPDGSGIYYTAVDDDGADIWRYDLASGIASPVTVTAPESEYSATPIPGMAAFSAIRVEADSTQRLWGFEADGSGAKVILPDVAPVGYHAWSSPDQVVVFVLGSPPTLQLANAQSGSAVVLTDNVGRSIQKLPGEAGVSFVQHLNSGGSTLMRWDESGSTSAITALPVGADFHAWTPDGWLLMGRGSELVGKAPGRTDGSWVTLADLAPLGVGTVSRLSVSPDGTKIAIVGEPGGG